MRDKYNVLTKGITMKIDYSKYKGKDRKTLKTFEVNYSLNKINELFDDVNDKYLKILNILKNAENIKLANKCCDKIERAGSSLNTIFGELSRVREILKFVDEYDNSEMNETISEFKKAAGISE